MTDVKVVDASAIAAVVFGEPEGEAVAAQLEGFQLVAPALFPFEIANVYLTKVRKERGKRDTLRAAYQLVHRLKVEIVAIDHAAALDLAEATGLTAYDAGYLWLAQDLQAKLVTLDKRLAAADTQLNKNVAD